MRYETPQLTTLMPAIKAVQDPKEQPVEKDGILPHEAQVGAYQDWE